MTERKPVTLPYEVRVREKMGGVTSYDYRNLLTNVWKRGGVCALQAV